MCIDFCIGDNEMGSTSARGTMNRVSKCICVEEMGRKISHGNMRRAGILLIG